MYAISVLDSKNSSSAKTSEQKNNYDFNSQKNCAAQPVGDIFRDCLNVIK